VGNLHATCDVAGAGNGATATSNRARLAYRLASPRTTSRSCQCRPAMREYAALRSPKSN